MGIATLFPPYEVNGLSISLIQHGVIEHEIANRGGDDLLLDIFPDQARRNAVVGPVAVEGVMAYRSVCSAKLVRV
jgi:hypothetical protein